MNIRNGVIEDIFRDRGNTFVTVSYSQCQCNNAAEDMVRLVVGPRTKIFSRSGREISASDLRVGMTINASYSSAVTRSIPPQAMAFVIRVVDSPGRDNVVEGLILDIDRRNRSFTTVSDRSVSSVIRFNVPEDAEIIGRNGREMDFDQLREGMRVEVRHADFMTASIPPQTTALKIRVL